MQYASDTLVHYIKMLFLEAGLRWNEDNESEVRSIIEDIAGSKPNTEKLNELRCKIASEQLAALIVRNDVPKWGMKDPNSWIVDESVRLTDLLLKKLAKEPES